ncbi:dihydrolipoyl dehydrogenase [Natronorubrum sp. FCH18a]|uniref:dihydrolipoyl dehydrogenase n=1 Tax=Natronorubrum sp. FCH18a TaxID=3447018 RepID=UPI003F5123A1
MVVGDIISNTELLVIGGGPGGYSAAIRAAQRDIDVTLVEKEAYGGTCLNHGCIPSKAYLAATGLAHRAGGGEHMGVHAEPTVDLPELLDWKNDVVSQLTGGVETLCSANGVTLIDGTAQFEGLNRVRIAHGGDGQGSESIEFEHAIIATGSRPIELPGFAFETESIWSARDAFATDTVPERLVVIGGGYIGMELSSVFARLGVDVTVVELLEDVLPTFEDDISRVVRERTEALGVEFNFGERAVDLRREADELTVVTETESGDESRYGTDRLLVAIGREPVTNTLSIESTGLETNGRGFIKTDDRARTAEEHIFAVGDVTGEPMLAHAATAEGVVAADVIAGGPAALDHYAIPAAVFTDPEIATVGLTANEAYDEGFDPVVGEVSFRSNGRALTADADTGFVRIVADDPSGIVLGGQIVGREASELVAGVGLAIELGATLEDVYGTVHTHPTLSEAVAEAAKHARNQAIHTVN